MFDQNEIRKDFRILLKNYIYFDNAATSLTPDQVVLAANEYYFSFKANVDRGAYCLAEKASTAYEIAHKKVAQFINADEKEVIFCRNATEAINILASGIKWKEGDKIVTTLMEHHSNFLPWLRLKTLGKADVEIVRPNEEGIFNLSDIAKAIDKKTKLVAISHVSNVLGCINPIFEISELAQKKGAWVLIDAAQSAPIIPIDVKKIGCHFLVASGHKMLGPTGIGFIYINKSIINEIDPPYVGGGTIENVSLDDYQLTDPWKKFEAGTPNISGAIGLGAAIDYILKIGLDNIQQITHERIELLIEGLKKQNKVTYFGPKNSYLRSSLVSFNIKNLSSHKVATMFDEFGNIQVGSGHHCALPLTKYLINQPQGTVRASLYVYNTVEEIESFLATLNDIVGML